MSKVAVAILLRGEDGGLRKDNFRVTRKLRCRESCSRDRLVITALMADGTTKPVLTLIEAGDAIEAGCCELATLSPELSSKQKCKGVVCKSKL